MCLQVKHACTVNECHNGDEVGIHPIDKSIVPDDEFSIRIGSIFRNLSTRFGEVAQLLHPLLDLQAECLRITRRIRFNLRHQRLEIISRNSRPDYASHPASSRMTFSCGMTCSVSIAS